MSEFFSKLFDTSDFPARWHCGNWSDFLGWLHIGSDLAIWAAYFAIPAALVYVARQQEGTKLPRLAYLFAAFILACGTTHLIDATIFWYPIYRVSGLAKFATAVISWVTVLSIVRLLPQMLQFPTLASTNDRLEDEVVQRLEIERELRAANARYLTLIDSTSSVLWTTDAAGQFVEHQSSWERFTGQSWAEHKGNGWINAVHEDDREELMSRWNAALATRSKYHIEARFWNAVTQSYHHSLAEAAPVLSDDGDVIEWVGKVRDLQEQRQAEAALSAVTAEAERRREELEQLYEHAPVGMSLLDREMRFIRINRKLAELNGLPQEAHIGKTASEVLDGSLDDVILPIYQRVFESGVPELGVEIVGKTPASEEERTWVASYYPVGKNGAVEAVSAIVQDVTKQKRDEEELRVFNERMNDLLESINDGFVSIDRSWRYRYVNPTAAKMLYQTVEQMLDQPIFDLFPMAEGTKFEESFRKTMETGEPTAVEDYLEPLDIWCACRVYPNRDGISIFFSDTTVQHQMLDRLRDSERKALAANQAKSEFLANMSHEIRTPMAAILGYADVLLGHLKDPDNQNCVQIIKRNGDYLLELINDILDLSRIEAGKLDVELESTDLPALVAGLDSLMQVRAADRKNELHVHFTTAVPQSFDTDSTRLRQVLINLLGNAIKFTEQGRVELAVGLVDDESDSANQMLEFAVTDTGIGMSDEQQVRLFQPFSQGDASVTRNFGGSGLGLAISQRLVEMLGGTISVESRLGSGSTFRVRLPINIDESDTLVKPSVEPDNSTAATVGNAPIVLNCSVLVVDDRRDVRHISQHFLEKAGARVAVAENGAEGVAAVHAAIEQGRPFDLIVMDMQMPVLDGIEATAQIRAAGIETPIVALTADAMDGDRDRCLAGGCTDYMSKPIDHELLVGKVAKHTSLV